MTVIRYIGKLLLECDGTKIFIILEDVPNTFAFCLGHGVRFKDGSDKIIGDREVYPLENSSVESFPRFLFNIAIGGGRSGSFPVSGGIV